MRQQNENDLMYDIKCDRNNKETARFKSQSVVSLRKEHEFLMIFFLATAWMAIEEECIFRYESRSLVTLGFIEFKI